MSTFHLDLDVRIPKYLLKRITDLANTFDFGYSTLQSTWDSFNICIEFSPVYEKQISEFLDKVNTIKLSLTTN